MFDFLFHLSRKSRVVNRFFSFIYHCEIPVSVTIGKNVTFNHRALGVVLHPNTVIEDNVYIEHHVCMGQKNGNDNSAPHICKDCVIGTHSVILGDVKIGEGSIIGACSLVTKSVPAKTIYYNKRIEETRINNKPIGHY